jgi:hypothetical protein
LPSRELAALGRRRGKPRLYRKLDDREDLPLAFVMAVIDGDRNQLLEVKVC